MHHLEIFAAILVLCWTQCNSQAGLYDKWSSECGTYDDFVSRGSSGYIQNTSDAFCSGMKKNVILIKTSDQRFVLKHYEYRHKSLQIAPTGATVFFDPRWNELNKIKTPNRSQEKFEKSCSEAIAVAYSGGCTWNIVSCEEIPNLLGKQAINSTQPIPEPGREFSVDIKSIAIGFCACLVCVLLVVIAKCCITKARRSKNREQIENATCDQDTAASSEGHRGPQNAYVNPQSLRSRFPGRGQEQSTTSNSGYCDSYEMQNMTMQDTGNSACHQQSADEQGTSDDAYQNVYSLIQGEQYHHAPSESAYTFMGPLG